MRRSNLKHTTTIVGLLLAQILYGPVLAADSIAEEYAVKAALLFNFACFTEWPDDTFDQETDVIRLMVFGNDSLGEAFESIDGKLAAGRPIRVEFSRKPEDAIGCHLLFLAKTERDQWPQIQSALGESPVLTIGEMNGFLESGGIMNLHLVRNKIRFQVNLDHARSRHLQVSSRILKFASSVTDEYGSR
jgi:YfiR/HmsC-like